MGEVFLGAGEWGLVGQVDHHEVALLSSASTIKDAGSFDKWDQLGEARYL